MVNFIKKMSYILVLVCFFGILSVGYRENLLSPFEKIYAAENVEEKAVTVIVNDISELQSEHSYPNNIDKTWVYSVDGAKELKIDFSQSTFVENNFDYIYIYDGENNEIGVYTGNELSNKSIYVTGNSIKVRLVSDDNGNDYGFEIVNVSTLESISVARKPYNTLYVEGQLEDYFIGMLIQGNYSDGSTRIIENYEIGSFDTSIGSKTIEVSYLNFVTSFVGEFVERRITEIQVKKLPDKTMYWQYQNEELDLSGFELWGYGDNHHFKIDEGFHILGFNTTKAGVKSIEVSYNFKGELLHKYFDITVRCPWTYTVDTRYADNPIYINGLDKDFSGNLIIPDNYNYKYISAEAFKNRSDLTGVSLPSSIVSIGKNAFYGCSGLVSMSIPDSVKSVGEGAFQDCTNLKEVSISNRLVKISANTFNGCISLNNIYGANSVETIDSYAFAYCMMLKSISIPDSVTSIGDRVFYECTSLNKINLPDGLTSIGEAAFYKCISLNKIIIPDSVNTSIGASTFNGCSSLESAILSDNINTIGSSAFRNCSSLKSIVIPNGTTYMGYYAFEGCNSLESIIVPGSVKELGGKVFFNCTKLKNVIMQSGVEEIGDSVFGGCTNLISVEIPGSVRRIGDSCFPDDISSLTIVTYHGALAEQRAKLLGINIKYNGNHKSRNIVIENSNVECLLGGSYEEVIYCELCGEELSRDTIIVEPGVHLKLVFDEMIDATCTTSGMTEGSHCGECGMVIEKQIEIPAKGHAWDDGIESVGATCENKGIYTYECEICHITKNEDIEALGHFYEETWTEDISATCITKGSKSHHCTRCEVKKDITEIEAIGHSWNGG